MTVAAHRRTGRRAAVVSAILLALLALAAPALAHVGVTPRVVAAGTTHSFEIRVPGERDDAETVEVSVELPDGLVAVAVEPVDGWTVTATTRPLDEPLELDGCTLTETLDVVTWSGGTIATDGAGSLPLVARAPAEPTTLAFPSLQVYDSGEEVAWVGEPGSANPAATVEVVPPDEADGPGDAELPCPSAATAPPAAATSGDDAGGDGAGGGTGTTAATAADGPAPDEGTGPDTVTGGTAVDNEGATSAEATVVTADGEPEDDDPPGVLPVVAIALVVAVVTVATIVARRG